MPAPSIVSLDTAVTLTGTFCLSSGSFWAVTVTVGTRKRRVESSWEEPDWPDPADCARTGGDINAAITENETAAGQPHRRAMRTVRLSAINEGRGDSNMCAIMHVS